jgi:hypothetical protein
MKILKILYFYYYSFYLKVDDEPHAMTVFALSISEALGINFVAELIAAHFYCYFIPKWPLLGVGVAMIIINYFLFIKSGISKKIVDAKAPIIHNRIVTRAFVILFFIVTTSFLFSALIIKPMVESCQ